MRRNQLSHGLPSVKNLLFGVFVFVCFMCVFMGKCNIFASAFKENLVLLRNEI